MLPPIAVALIVIFELDTRYSLMVEAAGPPAGEGAAEVPAFAPLYAVYAPVKREPATATLIPYFAWANRGENEMTVWLRG